MEGERLEQKGDVLALKIWHCIEKYKYLKESNCHLLISSESLGLKNKWTEILYVAHTLSSAAQHIQNVVQVKERGLAGATLVVKTSDNFFMFSYVNCW